MYVSSKYIKVYPTAYRGTIEVGQEQYAYNPESRLNSEFNIVNKNRQLSFKDSFIIKACKPFLAASFPENPSEEDYKIEFNIWGYWFRLNAPGLKEIANYIKNLETTPENIYAKIMVRKANNAVDNPVTSEYTGTEYEAWSLFNQNSIESVSAIILDNLGIFYGISFTTTDEVDPSDENKDYYHFLKILHKNSNDSKWGCPASELLQITANKIENNENEGSSIKEHFNTIKFEAEEGFIEESTAHHLTTDTLVVTNNTDSGNNSLELNYETGKLKIYNEEISILGSSSFQMKDSNNEFIELIANRPALNNDINYQKHIFVPTFIGKSGDPQNITIYGTTSSNGNTELSSTALKVGTTNSQVSSTFNGEATFKVNDKTFINLQKNNSSVNLLTLGASGTNLNLKTLVSASSNISLVSESEATTYASFNSSSGFLTTTPVVIQNTLKTRNILPETYNSSTKYNIGSSSLKYQNVYGDYFSGTSEAVNTQAIANSGTMYLVGSNNYNASKASSVIKSANIAITYSSNTNEISSTDKIKINGKHPSGSTSGEVQICCNNEVRFAAQNDQTLICGSNIKLARNTSSTTYINVNTSSSEVNLAGFNLTTLGTITASTYTATSDMRLKTDIEDYKYTNSILDLPVKTYKYKSDPKTTHIGCIAQDLKELYPELVHLGKDGYYSIEENKLVYLLLEEVKKLNKKVEELSKK